MYPNPNPSLFTKSLSFLKTIKWGNILDGTGKTLGVINQAIPIIYQVKPLFGNVKTLMKIANGLNSTSITSNESTSTSSTLSKNKNSPIFYVE